MFNSNSEKMIWVTFQKEGSHCYPVAATDPNLADVQFLSYPHRHMFYFKVWIEIFHNDRELEFIQFKRWLESLYATAVLELDYKSCEMIAEELYAKIHDKYPQRNVMIDVSEDNENGASMSWSKNPEENYNSGIDI